MGGQMAQAMWSLGTEVAPPPQSVLVKKIQNFTDDQVFEGSVALQSFYLLLSYPPC